MYKLYGNIEGWKELDQSNDEMDLVDTMGYYISNNCEINFIIKKETKDTDIIYKTIKTHKEYILYLQEVTQKYMTLKQAQSGIVKVKKK